MATGQPRFRAISSSARQLQVLLRCISFANQAQIRISPEGMRFSTEEGSVMEASVLLEKKLFSSYTYSPPRAPSSQEASPDQPVFEVNLTSLLETLNIFSLSDPNSIKKPEGYDSFAAHRLTRHAGINAFSNNVGMTGVCTLSYQGDGSPLSVHMSEAGVNTTCELNTYESQSTEEIPFRRGALALKTILRSSHLLDAIQELSAISPQHVTITATPNTRGTPELSFSASGALGSVSVDFTTATNSDTPILETFQCSQKASASFNFAMVKSAQRAMSVATKVSLRLDEEGVLSLQFLVELDGSARGEDVAFVDFRIVPMVDGEVDSRATSSEDDEA